MRVRGKMNSDLEEEREINSHTGYGNMQSRDNRSNQGKNEAEERKDENSVNVVHTRQGIEKIHIYMRYKNKCNKDKVR